MTSYKFEIKLNLDLNGRLIRLFVQRCVLVVVEIILFNRVSMVACSEVFDAGVLLAAGKQRSFGRGSCAPAPDAQYPSYKIKEFTTIVRLLYPYPRNTNARLRMTLQKFAWTFSLYIFRKAIFVRRSRYGAREIALVPRWTENSANGVAQSIVSTRGGRGRLVCGRFIWLL